MDVTLDPIDIKTANAIATPARLLTHGVAGEDA